MPNGAIQTTVPGTAVTLDIGAAVSTLALDFQGGLNVDSTILTAGTVTVGNYGNATLNITNGGSVTDAIATLSNHAGVGSVLVSGAGSRWNTSSLTVGNFGSGTLTIMDGGSVTDVTATLAYNNGGNGSVLVSGADSRWNTSNGLFVGQFTQGSVTVDSGATVSSGALTMGSNPGASATVTLSGIGTTWTITGAEGVGDLAVGTNFDTAATLNIQSGAQLVDSNPISSEANIGSYGNGALNISGGGRLITHGAKIGYARSGVGTVLVTDPGSTWGSGSLSVGYDGRGTLSIQAGGSVTSANSILGDHSGSIGVVLVSGTDATWTDSGVVSVGSLGSGSLAVDNGGRVNIGNYTQSLTGTTSVIGSGSLTAASVNINGGTLLGTGTVSGATTVASGAILLPGLDTVTPGTLSFSTGSLRVNGTFNDVLTGTGFGIVTVAGDLILDSNSSILQISQDASYVPPLGTTLVITTASSKVIGRFHTILNRIFDGGAKKWHVRYNKDGNNVQLLAIANVCGDERDYLIQEYLDYGIGLTPSCANFTRTAHSDRFSFLDLSYCCRRFGDGRGCAQDDPGDYGWALFRRPLVISESAGYGVDRWISLLDQPNNRRISSGYRHPACNFRHAGAPQGQHMFGTAVDLLNESHTPEEWFNMADVAINRAGADFVEGVDGSGRCDGSDEDHGGCVHADWRYTDPDNYAQAPVTTTDGAASSQLTLADLLAQLQDQSWETRSQAFYQLLQLKFMAGAKRPGPWVDSATARLLEGVPAEAERLKGALANLLGLENATRKNAGFSNTEAFAEYHGDLIQAVTQLKDVRSLTSLMSCLDSGNMAIRTVAAFGDSAVDPVIAVLGSVDPLLRLAGTMTLVQMLDPMRSGSLKSESLSKIEVALTLRLSDDKDSIAMKAKEGLALLHR